jgi:hypothetical protein
MKRKRFTEVNCPGLPGERSFNALRDLIHRFDLFKVSSLSLGWWHVAD